MQFLPRLTLTLALLLPATAHAVGLSASDTIAGLPTEISMTGFPAGSSIDVAVDTPDGDSFEQTVSIDSSGRAVAVVNAEETQTAGRYDVRALNASTSFDVFPDRLDAGHSSITVSTSTITPDGSDTVTVTVQLRDRFGNPLSDRPVSLISSRSDDTVVPDGDATDAQGRQQFRLATTAPGQITLRAMDLLSGIILDSTTQISAGGIAANSMDTSILAQLLNSMMLGQTTGTTGLIDHFIVTIPATMEVDKEASKIGVKAVDKSGNVVENYTGTVKFTSTDTAAALPNFGTYTFKQRDLGQKEFPLVLKFRSAGKQKLRVEDSQDNRIFGEAEVTVTGKAGPVTGTISITNPIPGQTLGGTEIQVEGNGPALINIAVKGGAKTVNGDTDQSGHFSVSVPVSAGTTQATLTVEDDQGRYKSEPVTVRLDASEPDVGAVTFTPARPQTGTQTLVVVKSEPDLQSVTITLSGPGITSPQAILLLENIASPGAYQTFFTAPAAGAYQALVQTTDSIGNTGKVITNITVDPESLPIVTGLRGEAKNDSVTLEWTSVAVNVDGYRIYVGETEDDFLYTLDTNIDQTKATVKGLLPGHRYYFAVTAVRGDQESKDKSSPLGLDTVGIRLTAIPQDTSLMLQWSGVPASLPLQSYILEYGVTEGGLSEKRILSGDAENYVMRDLINGVQYFLKLTPIAVTGEKRDDLAVTAAATPSGDPNSFRPTPGDPIPDDISLDDPLIGPEHEGAPKELNTVGLAGHIWIPAAGLALMLCAGYLYRRHRILQTQAFLQALASRDR